MRKFSDRDGREWNIDLTIGTVFRVRAESDGRFDLLDPAKDTGGQPLQSVLAMDVLAFWELLWLLVESQAKAIGVTVEQFGQSMAADCLVQSQLEFFAEWRDFFHSLRRPDMALAVETQMKTLATAIRLVGAKVAEINPEKMQTTIDLTIERAVNASFGNVQASLESIRVDTPGGNST